jgi:hypothetical protein
MKVLRIAKVLFLLTAVATGAGAQSPDDLSFRLRLTKDPPQYAVDEPVTFEVSLSSSAENKYHGKWMSLGPWSGAVIQLEPQDGAVDLRAMAQGFVGSLPGGSGLLTSRPVSETGDLTQWYRFEKAGHFRFSVSVNWVSRVKTKEEGGGKEQIPLASNAVEFDVVATEESGQAPELESIVNEIEQAKNEVERQTPLHRLDLLQTPAAAEEKARRYLKSAHNGYSAYYEMLQHSSELDGIIPLLEAALSDPESDPPGGMVALLADLQVRKQMGTPPAWPANEADQERVRAMDMARAKLRDQLFAEYAGVLLKSVQARSGPERADAVFEAWANAEQQHAGADAAPELLVQLRTEAVGISRDLSPDQQLQLLNMEWSKMPHEQLLPILQRLAAWRDSGAGVQYWGYKFWCEDWPADCTKALLAEVIELGFKLEPDIVLLVSEAEHPELDSILQRQLEAQAKQPGVERLSTAALVLRAGSKNIQPIVDQLLAGSQIRGNCQSEGYLLGYLFRVAPGEAAKRLAHSLENGNVVFCQPELLRELGEAKHIEPAIPVVSAAVSGGNLKTAVMGALFLGQHGPASTRATLEKRLAALREQWRGRTDEIACASEFGDVQRDTAGLERALISALAHAAAWKLMPEEQQALAAGCMTAECRDIAEGKSWIGP